MNASACGLKSRIELLTDLRARYVTAEKDLPERRLSLALAEQTVARVLALIDHSSEQNPARLVLSAGVTGSLRDLMEQRSGVEAALASAEAELTKAGEALSEAEATVGEQGAGLDEATTATLTAIIASARQADDAARLRAADRVRGERADELEDCLIELLPWTGGRNELLSVPVPTPDRLRHWISTEADLSREVALRQGEFDRVDADSKRLEAKIKALGSAAGVISDQEAGEARSAREAAWAVHKVALDATTATDFETAMRKLDLITEQRSSQAASVADLNRTLLDLAEARASLEQARRQLEESRGRRATLAEEIGEAVRAIGNGLDDRSGLTGLNLWMQKRDRAVEAQGKLRAAERELRRTQADAADSRERIAETMRAAGVEISRSDDLAAMLAVGQAALDRAAGAKNLRTVVEGRRRDLKVRETKLHDARLAERSWNTAWREACAACWLVERGSEPTMAVVRGTLEALTDLGSELEKKAELTDRISKMERNQNRFRAEVEALADLIELPPSPQDVLGRCEAIVDCVASATKALDRRLEIEARLAAEQDKARSAADEMADVQSRASVMMNHFGTDSLAEVDGRLRSLARRSDIETRLSQAREEILEGMKVETIEQAEDMLDAVERSSLEAELIALRARFEDEDSRSRERFAALNRAEDRIAAVGGDDAVAVLESKRRTVLMTIEDRAIEYLKLKLGIAAAERALRAYRDRHRSSMMARASEAFALISRGAYSGLLTQPSNGSELLIAKGVDGGSKIASELSKGTRFQLYLALRVAGYHEFARARAPAPFLADDIMETFDDSRAEEAFRLLAEMAGKGQVVYFTHHRHLCEIARAVEPSIKVHTLKAEPTRGWALSILKEAGAIRECEEHGWMQDSADPHARERALEIARRDPLVGLSDRAAAALIGDVLDDLGDTCPECLPD